MKVTAAFAQSVDQTIGSIVYLPEGRHTINASQGGKPVTLDVEIDESILSAFRDGLQERQAQNVRPFAGFDHAVGAASFIPLEFRYEAGTGLVLDVEWTKAGQEAIEGKDYSYFSPTFLVDKNGKPKGLPVRGEIGSLVNDPAFSEIPRIAASDQTEIMKDILEALIELALVPSDTQPENAMEAARAYIGKMKPESEVTAAVSAARAEIDGELVQARSTIADLQGQVEALRSEADKARDKEIEAEIAAAVEAGRIAPQDEATVNFWKSALKSNADAVSALRAIPAKDLTTPIIANRTEAPPAAPELKGIEKVEAAFKAQKENQ